MYFIPDVMFSQRICCGAGYCEFNTREHALRDMEILVVWEVDCCSSVCGEKRHHRMFGNKE
jgi:hypothetical protein